MKKTNKDLYIDDNNPVHELSLDQELLKDILEELKKLNAK